MAPEQCEVARFGELGPGDGRLGPRRHPVRGAGGRAAVPGGRRALPAAPPAAPRRSPRRGPTALAVLVLQVPRAPAGRPAHAGRAQGGARDAGGALAGTASEPLPSRRRRSPAATGSRMRAFSPLAHRLLTARFDDGVAIDQGGEQRMTATYGSHHARRRRRPRWARRRLCRNVQRERRPGGRLDRPAQGRPQHRARRPGRRRGRR